MNERMLRQRVRKAHETARDTSRVLWMNQAVPVELCIKQGAIVRRWREMQTQLGGCAR